MAAALEEAHDVGRAPEEQHAHHARKVACRHALQRRALRQGSIRKNHCTMINVTMPFGSVAAGAGSTRPIEPSLAVSQMCKKATLTYCAQMSAEGCSLAPRASQRQRGMRHLLQQGEHEVHGVLIPQQLRQNGLHLAAQHL